MGWFYTEVGARDFAEIAIKEAGGAGRITCIIPPSKTVYYTLYDEDDE